MGISIKGKIALITGASSGIGKACAEQFARAGARLILTARRLDRLETLAEELRKQYGVDVLPLALDVQNKEQVKVCIEGLQTPWQEIDILINNAGLAVGLTKMQEGKVEDWDRVIQTNVNGLLYMTHAVLSGMVARNRGHIVNMGSIAGRNCYPGGNIYCATKYAVKAISESLRFDLLGKEIRVSEIAPGAVETEFSEVRFQDKAAAQKVYEGFKPLIAEDIADAILYCVTRPSHMNVSEMVIYPVQQSSVYYFHREGI